jgi:hypothetical protein
MSITTKSKKGFRTIGTAQELGCDPDGGKWVAICETHCTVVNVATKAIALTLSTDDFCEYCQSQEAPR